MKSIKSGNLFDVKSGIIVHGCNALGVMGSGVAKTVRELYPKAYEEYKAECDKYSETPEALMGKVIFVEVAEGLIIANAITQLNFGTHKRQVNYEAVYRCFEYIRDNTKGMTVHYPLIGAGLGSGNWKIISTIIEETLIGENHVLWIRD